MSLLTLYQQQFNEADLRAEIQEIVRSYRHSWDIYSELIQNSVDAINRKFKIFNDPLYYLYEDFRKEHGHINPDPDYRGRISVYWNKSNRQLTITDNGIGMPEDKIQNYILPKGTGKIIGKDYGFKGYGFTFAAFVSEKVSIKSKVLNNANTYEVSLNGCFDWLAKQGPFPNGPLSVPVEITDLFDESGTEITINLSDEYANYFPAVASLDDAFDVVQTAEDINKLEYILRTKTAIGNTRYLFGEEPVVPIDVQLTVVIDGKETTKPIKYNYYHPKDHEEVKVLSYDFEEYVGNLSNVAFQKDFRALYYSKTAVEIGTVRKIKIDVALCAVSQTRLNNIESSLGIPKNSDYDLTYGIHLAINGMPTGIRIDNWESGGGYLKRYFVIVDADISMSEQLDSGRKGISKYYANLISSEVIKMFGATKINGSSSFGSFALSHLDSGVVIEQDEADDFQTILNKIDDEKKNYTPEELETLTKIQNYSSLLRIPRTEQETIALFYHLLEKEIIKGYRTAYLSGIATYDAALTYKIKLDDENNSNKDPLGVAPAIFQAERAKGRDYYDIANFRRDKSSELCVEFKQSLGSFLQEIQGKTEKNPSNIDILVCWNKNIPSNVPTSSYTLGNVHDSQRRFHSTTHRLGIIGPTNNTEIYCIVIEEVINKLR